MLADIIRELLDAAEAGKLPYDANQQSSAGPADAAPTTCRFSRTPRRSRRGSPEREGWRSSRPVPATAPRGEPALAETSPHPRPASRPVAELPSSDSKTITRSRGDTQTRVTCEWPMGDLHRGARA